MQSRVPQLGFAGKYPDERSNALWCIRNQILLKNLDSSEIIKYNEAGSHFIVISLFYLLYLSYHLTKTDVNISYFLSTAILTPSNFISIFFHDNSERGYCLSTLYHAFWNNILKTLLSVWNKQYMFFRNENINYWPISQPQLITIKLPEIYPWNALLTPCFNAFLSIHQHFLSASVPLELIAGSGDFYCLRGQCIQWIGYAHRH